jgi:hypothetical protein
MKQAANELFNEARLYYLLALDEECTCGSMPEDPCRFCNRMEKAERRLQRLIDMELER